MVASLSSGKCQKATRKAVARVLLNSASLRGQFLSRRLTLEVDSPLYNMLVEQCSLDSEEEEVNEDDVGLEMPSKVSSESGNKREYQATFRDVKVGRF